MAQTKKRRNRKHRGTQGGSINRRPKRRPQNRAEARSRAKSRSKTNNTAHRLDKPPTWRNAWARGAFAAGVFFLLMLLGFGRAPVEAAGLALFMLAIYAPFGYYFDLFLYRRRQRKKQQERQERAES
jgi:Flp pilus assembly protein TadB